MNVPGATKGAAASPPGHDGGRAPHRRSGKATVTPAAPHPKAKTKASAAPAAGGPSARPEHAHPKDGRNPSQKQLWKQYRHKPNQRKKLFVEECVELELFEGEEFAPGDIVGTGRKALGRATYDSSGTMAVALRPGQVYGVRVRNVSREKFVVRAGKMCGDGGEKVPFLVGDEGSPAGKGGPAFKPLFQWGTAAFPGYETKYHKENYELTLEYHSFRAAGNQDLVHAAEGADKGAVKPRCDEGDDTHDPIETIYVDVFENVGKWTYNRGGASKKSERKVPDRTGVLIAGERQRKTSDCSAADSSWESRQGAFLGTINLTVRLQHF